MDNKLPSTNKLIKSTIYAIIIAALILVTTVLPAEYGIDPTGVGDMLGLKTMGEIKVSLAEEAALIRNKEKSTSENAKELSSNSPQDQLEVKEQSGVMAISLNPNEGKELKVFMNKGNQINFSWWTNGGEINFDSHSDSEDYHNYSKGLKDSDEGILEAVYDGRHGWWWKNRSSEKVTITLQVEGLYADLRIEP